MGICLSCLRDDDRYDDELNEQTSLLRNEQFGGDYIQEEELLKQQERQKELNTIVNDLSNNLIDVSTFLNGNNGGGLAIAPNISNSNHSLQNNSHISHSTASTNGDGEKQYPYIATDEQKRNILEAVKSLDSKLKDSCKVELQEPLFLSF